MTTNPLNTIQNERINAVVAATEELTKSLQTHPLYGAINSMETLHTFMEHHIFAVWDFMSLLKTLQRKMTCVAVPWTPPADPALCRFINEIVVAEESDEMGDGTYGSHFDLYLRAMKEVGANTQPIERFVELVNQGERIDRALDRAGAPDAAARFTSYTMDLGLSGSLVEAASAFTFGREDVIPTMFDAIVRDLEKQAFTTFDNLLYYLHRHIELDGDEHGPLSLQLIDNLCGNNNLAWKAAEEVARTSLRERTALWDGVVRAINLSEAHAA